MALWLASAPSHSARPNGVQLPDKAAHGLDFASAISMQLKCSSSVLGLTQKTNVPLARIGSQTDFVLLLCMIFKNYLQTFKT